MCFAADRRIEERNMGQTYTLRIRNGARQVRRSRFILWWKGFTCIRKGDYCYYEKKECSKRDCRKMERFCERKGFRLQAVPSQYTRSSDYRRQFFANQPPLRGMRYRCAYCGRKKKKEDITIDHIFPVHGLELSERVRRRAALHGIHGANDLRNLCTACRRCNQRKGAKMGGWITKGFLGRHEWYWRLRHFLFFVIVCIIIWFVLNSGLDVLALPQKQW